MAEFNEDDGDSFLDYSNAPNKNDKHMKFYENQSTLQNTNQLEFQDINDELTNNIPFEPSEALELEDFLSDTPLINSNEEEKEEPLEIGDKFWEISYYRRVYNVTTRDVYQRIIKTINPIGETFFEFIGNNADLYGWIWISMTLAFLIAATGNLSEYINYLKEGTKEKYIYDFTKLTFGATTVIVYVTIIPLISWAGFSLWLQIPVGLVANLCVFGYSLFPYVPASIIMTIPYNPLRWIIIIIACSMVSIFLIRSYLQYVMKKPMEGGGILLFIVICNIIFALVIKFAFFPSIPVVPIITPPPSPSITPSITSSITPSKNPSLSPSISIDLTSSSTVSSSISYSPPPLLPSPILSPSPSISFTPSISSSFSISPSPSISQSSLPSSSTILENSSQYDTQTISISPLPTSSTSPSSSPSSSISPISPSSSPPPALSSPPSPPSRSATPSPILITLDKPPH